MNRLGTWRTNQRCACVRQAASTARQQGGSVAQSRESEECMCYSEGCQRPCSAPATGPDLICPPHPYDTPRKGKTEHRAEPFLPFSPTEAEPLRPHSPSAAVYIEYCACNALGFFTSSRTDCTMNARKHCNRKPDGPIYPTRDNASHVNMRGLTGSLDLGIL